MNLRNLTAANAPTVALALSDGTPVEFVKITSKDNIQVRVPTSHSELGDDPLRIFDRDGDHYKGATDLTLVVANDTAPAADVPAPTPTAAAPTPTPVAPTPVAPTPVAAAPTGDTVYTVGNNDFDNLRDAKQEAIDLFMDSGNDVEIIATTRKVIGRVGFTALAA